MSNLQIIEGLCRICEAQNHIIRVQASALSQLGAVVLEEERAAVARSLSDLIGSDEPSEGVEAEAAALLAASAAEE